MLYVTHIEYTKANHGIYKIERYSAQQSKPNITKIKK